MGGKAKAFSRLVLEQILLICGNLYENQVRENSNRTELRLIIMWEMFYCYRVSQSHAERTHTSIEDDGAVKVKEKGKQNQYKK